MTPTSTTARRPGSGIIVIVEDPVIQRFVHTVLGRNGHSVMETDAADARKLAAEGPGSVKLVITNRPDVFENLAEPVPILYLSTSPDWSLVARIRNLRVLQKPFLARELLEAVGAP